MSDTIVRLRLLATTDLHMQLTGWDYAKDRPLPSGGLTRVASLISDARKEAAEAGAHVLLFDNGDGFQGTVLGELADSMPPGENHPLLAVFQQLRYDAIGLGNHDFDFGATALSRWLADASCPVISSNLRRLSPGILPGVNTSAALDAGPLRVGVVSVLPPQTAMWNAGRLTGQVAFDDMTDAAQREAFALHQQGCDVIVALAHTGWGEDERQEGQENALSPIARLQHVTAVFGGHTHLPSTAAKAGSQAPVALAGHAGRQLAQIDLALDRGPSGRWEVRDCASVLRPADRQIAEQTETKLLLASRHRWARERMSEPAGWTDVPLHSYFSMVRADTHLRVIAEAQRAAFAQAGHGVRDYPVISVVAPGKCGGRGGPAHYSDVPAGAVQWRHIEDLVVFPNALRAVMVRGEELREWLEMSASVFRRVIPGQSAQLLIDADWPAHGFDTFFGLSYGIDVSQPARYRPDGRMTDPGHHRISDLTCDGQPIVADMMFTALLNDYRANGGGNVPALRRAPRLELPEIPLRNAVMNTLSSCRAAPTGPDPWRFVPLPGTGAVLQTGPGAAAFLDDIADFEPSCEKPGPDGFLPVNLSL